MAVGSAAHVAGAEDIVQLDQDHPGFRDPAYRARRNEIARIALEHVDRATGPARRLHRGGARRVAHGLGEADARCTSATPAAQYLSQPRSPGPRSHAHPAARRRERAC